jgi:hypothetical protein
MKRVVISFLLISASSLLTFGVLAECGSYFQEGTTTFSGSQCNTAFSKTSHWHLFYTDGHEANDVQVTEAGRCFDLQAGGHIACYPGYDAPFWVSPNVGINRRTIHIL